MDSTDWLEELNREAWAARIRQLHPQLLVEREQVQRFGKKHERSRN